MKIVDLIVPCYNEEETLPSFFQETQKVLTELSDYHFHYIFIDDGSKDKTLLHLQALSKNYEEIDYLSFSRNFGKEAAMYAGLRHSTGDYVIIMDADLQHPPAMIPQMLTAMEEGYDCCSARRTSRKGESFIRSAFSRSFYHITNRISSTKMAYGAVDFRIMSRAMIDSILQLSEVERFSKGIFSWVGYQTKWLPYENIERVAGTSKWSFWGLFKYAIDGITAFSVVPLHLLSAMGILISLVAFIYILITLAQTLIFGVSVPGYTTTLCTVLFLGGIMELSIGILGQYIARIYMETKNRPVYIVQRSSFPKNSHYKANFFLE
ncbi:glycosyl transferase [Clostridia bacterium]|nr:glycosyl transferase [Clostridia bacterium]